MVKRDRDRALEGTAPGRRGMRRVEVRAAYFALVNTGVGYREAARTVGVNYRTTKYWRAARATPPPASAPRVISPRYLSEAERILIADRLRDNTSLRSIARELGRPVSTISREKARNQQPGGVYQPHAAHTMALARRARPKTGKIAADPALRAVVQDGLEQRHSPEQIARRLRRIIPTGRSGT